ncbi:tRNA pseudouridine synthase A [Agrococcus casei LMG 22410]|uniref:tRNA pseudouridine synthase A n=2 Tax=Agrococcus TaxID=46352 RepID=A0A1R4FBA4_9MICO|nr:tRNA pseudouridine synthase A [Agrococcus casei LMG 22410]
MIRMPACVRIRLDIAYDGTDFSGWARQPVLRTCQGLLEAALSTVLQREVTVTVAGRTDAGVHATGQVAHFDAPEGFVLDDRLPQRLNSLMRASDIAVLAASVAPVGFDARFSAISRSYRYRLQFEAPNPLVRDRTFWPRPLDADAMQRAAEALIGLNDFAAFCKPREGATTIRHLREFSWHEVETDGPGRVLEARLLADAFCHSMVRSLVGACVAVGEGRMNLAKAESLLSERKRVGGFTLMPPQGLVLHAVGYPPEGELEAQSRRARAKRSEEDVQSAARYDA